MTTDKVAGEISAHLPSHSPVLIGIDGFGGAGKTTIAEMLAAKLGDCYVIHLDDFIDKNKVFEKSWDRGGFDRKRLERQVLLPLLRGESAKYQKRLWAENKLSRFFAVPKSKFLIVEGTSSTHPEIAGYFDYKIWVDTPIEVAKARGQARDSGNENEKFWDLWAANDREYQQKYHPEKSADFVVENG